MVEKEKHWARTWYIWDLDKSHLLGVGVRQGFSGAMELVLELTL